MAKRKRIRGFLFDIDGTLIDSNDAHARSWSEAFRECGKRIPFDKIRDSVGKGGDLLVPDLLTAKEMQKFGEKTKKIKKRIFKKKYLPKIRPFPGICEAFEQFRDRGIRIALASSADPDEAKSFIKLLGIEDYLDAATSKKDANLSKPSPEIFQAALKQLGTPLKETVVVGDTPYDILAAHRASLPIVAVRTGGFDEALLAKAEFLYDDVPDLARRLDEIDDYLND